MAWRVFRSLKRFRGDERGAALILVGGCLLALIAAVGAGVDIARAELVRTRLSSALDASGLAVGSVVTRVNLDKELQKYMAINFPSGYLNSKLSGLSISANASQNHLVLDASASVPTVIMKVFGHRRMNVSAHSEIIRETRGMEMALVMDTTGSMERAGGGGLTKLQAAKKAAKLLIDILYGAQDASQDLKIGLVPFSQAVNVGADREDWVVDDDFDWGATPWEGCVEAREQGGRDVTDDPPTIAKFPQYYAPDADHNKGCPPSITMMTGSKTKIVEAIDAMQAEGFTHINLGMVWGWRLLSPRWRGLWGGTMDAESLPFDYGLPHKDKVVVLLSDGDNTTGRGEYTAYGSLADGRLGTTNDTAGINSLNARTRQVCDSMKERNIIIYSIAFGKTITGGGKSVLRNCATRPEYYFESPDAARLQTAFSVIGSSLVNLRISR